MMIFNVLILTLNFFVFFICLLVFRKVRKIHNYRIEHVVRQSVNNMFVQVESLIGLYNDLDLEKSLPKTRGWAGSPDFLMFIAKTAQKNKPRTIIECSCGVSTIALAQSLKLCGQGHVYSLEHEPKFAELTREELERHDLKDWATIIDAPLVKHQIHAQEWVWYSLESLPKNIEADLIVIDGPPKTIGYLARYPAGPCLFCMLSERGVVIVDDTSREDEQEIIKMWKNEYSKVNITYFQLEKGCCLLSFDAVD